MADLSGAQAGQPVHFILRDSYQETLELLRQRQIDVAWLCDCPHITNTRNFKLLATPVFQGRPFYRAYLIVPETDRPRAQHFRSKNKVFAFTDPYSNVGYLFPRYELKKAGEHAEMFFRRKIFSSWSPQRKSVEAVAVGVADAASVNSYIWETMNEQAPVLTGRTRIVTRSEEYGFPPFVADKSYTGTGFCACKKALLEMSGDASGRDVLQKMNLDGFIEPDPKLYLEVGKVVRFMQHP